MSELISKEQAMAYPLSYEHYDKVHGSKKFINGVESYRDYIDGLPTVEERRHGHWDYSNIAKQGCKCSVCNRSSKNCSPFCQWCGAIMNGGERE